MKDYYGILEIKRNASLSEVKRAYRKLARRFHPDLNPNDMVAEQKFKEISEAYEVLRDPKKRKHYDTYGHMGRDFSRNRGGHFSDFAGFNFQQQGSTSFNDIFQTIFRDAAGGRYRNRTSRPPATPGENLHYYMTLSFQDAVRGLKIPIQLKRKSACPRCKGRGVENAASSRVCPVCKGSGKVHKQTGFMKFQAPCQNCQGRGYLKGTPCSSCQGEGRVDEDSRIIVTIPPGVDDNAKLRIAGKGNAGKNGGTAGDLIISIKVDPHRFFQKKDGHLFLELPVTYTEAALGAKIAVPTLNGKALMKIPPTTSSGQKFRLRGKGIVNPKTGKPGDMVVAVKIVSPSIKDLRVRELLRELEKNTPDNPREAMF